ncbi:MAG: Ig-like domain-containing protein, partial [Muribaculaceae bacterium]|nr:Ig-like domain-containing protein [Muribaculaceae bacterium]
DNVTDKTIIWTSSDPTIATVDSNGFVTAVSCGEVDIIASCGGISSFCKVLVTEIYPEEIIIESYPKELGIGEEFQLIVRVLPENTTNKNLAWSSDNNQIAIVNDNGFIKGISQGNVNIRVSCGQISEEIMVKVMPILPTAIKIYPYYSLDLEPGTSYQLETIFTPSNTTDKTLNWISSDPEIADVDCNGRVYAKKLGTTKITATSGELRTSIDVNVADHSFVGAVLNESSLTLEPFQHYKLKPTFIKSNESARIDIRWRSENPEIAIVSNDGSVCAVNKGKTRILAEIGNQYTCSCEVEVLESPDLPDGATFKIVQFDIDELYPVIEYGDEVSRLSDSGVSLEFEKPQQLQWLYDDNGKYYSTIELSKFDLFISSERYIIYQMDMELDSATSFSKYCIGQDIQTATDHIATIKPKGNQFWLWANYHCGYIKSINVYCIDDPSVVSRKPTFIYNDNGTVEIRATEGSVIVYTTDGSDPNDGGYAAYGSTTIRPNSTIKAYARENGKVPSEVTTFPFNPNAILNVADFYHNNNYSEKNRIFIGNAVINRIGDYTFMHDDTGSILIDTSKKLNTGDLISAFNYTGYAFWSNMYCINNIENLEVTNHNLCLPDPKIITLEEVDKCNLEDYVRIDNVSYDSGKFTDANGNYIRVDNMFGLSLPSNTEKCDLIGYLGRIFDPIKNYSDFVICPTKFENIPPRCILLDQTSATLQPTQEINLKPFVFACEGDLIWTSSHPQIANVDSRGKITAESDGIAIIMVHAKDAPSVFATCVVTVTPPILATSLLLNKSEITAKVGDEFKLNAVVLPENATNKRISWSSSNEDIATVDEEGNVKIVGDHDACVITAATTDGSGQKAECMVNGVTVGIYDVIQDNMQLDVYSTTGMIVKQNINIKDLNDLSKGIYIIKYGNTTRKIMIK